MERGRRTQRLAALFLAVALIGPVALAAQQPPARLVGRVSSAFNGRPLAGVMVAVPAARAFDVTDSTGRFALSGLPAGTQQVRIAYLGRQTEEYDIELRAGKAKRLAVLLSVDAVDLAPVVVEASHLRERENLVGFYERKKWYGGFGRFYTEEDLEHRSRISSVLAAEGIFPRCNGAVGCLPVRISRGRQCTVPVFLDGVPFVEGVDYVSLDEVAGVEVYRNDLVAPATIGTFASFDFLNRGSRYFEPSAACGAIYIWTRAAASSDF